MGHRIVLPNKGSYEVFKTQEFQCPDPRPKEVKIEVYYSGVNFADCLMRQGLYQDAPAFPFTPGYEISGIITAVGKDSKYNVGEKVIGGTLFNGYCSEITLPEEQVIPLPNHFSLAEGASILVSYLTSYMVFIEQARAREGDEILIDCATGALGFLSYEILKKKNVDVIGLTSSPNKKEYFKQKGKTILLPTELGNRKFDIILNSRGGGTLKQDFKRLKPNGRLISIGISNALNASFFNKWKTLLTMPWFWVVRLINQNKGVFGLNVLNLFSTPEIIQQALSKLTTFDIKAPEVIIFKASEIGKAQRYIEQKKSTGKVLISWRD